ncbi:MAG: transposase [Lentisphaerae bacterium]|nr:transposase [Lentisphaerota bacterium]
MQKDFDETIQKLQQELKAMENRALKAERSVDELKEANLELRRNLYAVETELEEEREKNQKLTALVNRDHENSSMPSSLKPNRKKITNNREKTGRKPGGQAGHKGHGRKKQTPTIIVEIPAPKKYLNNPEYETAGIKKHRQKIGIRVLLDVVEYHTEVFRHKKTGKLVHAAFPEGVNNDVNYDGSVKAFAFLLNNFCNVSIAKVRQILSDLTNGALEISTGMINGLSREFAAKTAAQQSEIFSALVAAEVLNVDFTSAKVNGKNANVFICATPEQAAFYAKERKGHEGIKGTPAELNGNILVHDHDRTYYSYGRLHQECLIHILRYLLASMQNEKDLVWNVNMRELLREMIHYRNSLGEEEDPDPDKIREFESRFDVILDTAEKEYDYEPPSKYFRDGYNLYRRMREYKDACLLFLHDKNVPSDNNRCERLARIFKRKQKQAMTFRSFHSLACLCQCLTVMETLRSQNVNFYQSIVNVFD